MCKGLLIVRGTSVHRCVQIIPAVLDVRSDLQDGQVLLTLDFGNPLLVEWR